MDPAYSIVVNGSPLVAVAVHAGHTLRPEVANLIVLDDGTRRREEDPGTDRLTSIVSNRVVVDRSRFEVDLNRPRDSAVYERPEDAWGLRVWRDRLPGDVASRSLAIHDAFYTELGAHLDVLAAAGAFVVLDLHSYNHRRDGIDASPAPVAENPEVNVGTDSIDWSRWAPLVEGFMVDLAQQEVSGHRLDVRENVRFRGGHLARWVNERYAARGCALAIELKKTFMNEWTGDIDDVHLDALRGALAGTTRGLLDALELARR
jgi:N-formylglutamate amidohydrolase